MSGEIEYIPCDDDGQPVDYEPDFEAESERPTISVKHLTDLEAERRCIGSMLLNAAAIPPVIATLTDGADEFADHHCAAVYRAAVAVHMSGKPIGDLTIRDRLIETGDLDRIGGIAKLMDLISSAVSTVATHMGAETYAKIIHNAHIRRLLARCATQVGSLASNTALAAPDAMAQAVSLLAGLSKRAIRDDGIELSDVTDAALEAVCRRAVRQTFGQVGVLASGFMAIDGLIGGFEAGSLSVIAARPSCGKTAFCLQVAETAAATGVRVLVFSCEMHRLSLAERMLAGGAGFNTAIARTDIDDVSMQALRDRCRAMKSLPIRIVDKARPKIDTLRAMAQAEHGRRELGLVVVDYIGLVRGERSRYERRDLEIGDVTAGLKEIAKELGVPVIAACQLNRQGTGKPELHHLRESGNIEQDADVVVLVWQPGGFETAITDFIVAKNRNGPTGTATLSFDRANTRFVATSPTDYGNTPEAEPQTRPARTWWK